ncbi:hypothetical protein REPUB_Repub11eG0022700 [Reevesia pubescens]
MRHIAKTWSTMMMQDEFSGQLFGIRLMLHIAFLQYFSESIASLQTCTQQIFCLSNYPMMSEFHERKGSFPCVPNRFMETCTNSAYMAHNGLRSGKIRKYKDFPDIAFGAKVFSRSSQCILFSEAVAALVWYYVLYHCQFHHASWCNRKYQKIYVVLVSVISPNINAISILKLRV